MARLARVSVGTVSNVLNRPDRVNDATRAKVEAAIAELGYIRNESARQLRAGRSRTIGMVVLDVANPFFTDVARGVEKVAGTHDVLVTLSNSDNDPARQALHVDALAQQRVRGVLITPVDSAADVVHLLSSHRIPVVLVDRVADTDQHCSVSVDDLHGGRLAGEHLTDMGHERIGYIGGPFSIRQVSERLEGLRAGAPEAEVDVVQTQALGVRDGRAAVEQLIARAAQDRPTAVFCANDLIALGVLQGAATAGIAVPDDLAIVGYDDIEFAAAAATPLSSVLQPREELGRAATELLLEESGDDAERHTHRQVVFRPQLVVRASSDLRRLG